ncbi:PH domain-containing protein [Streptomyces sp. NPDC054826]
MSEPREVICRPRWAGTLWFLAGLCAAGTSAAVALAVATGALPWLIPALLCASAGVAALHRATGRVRADAHGLHVGSLVRSRSVPWADIADLRVHLKYANTPRTQDVRRTVLVLTDGRKRVLPLPIGVTAHDPYFDATLDALRALHRRHGNPRSDHLPVVSHRTAGRGWAVSLLFCVLLLAGAGLAAWAVPQAQSHERDWRSAAPCGPSGTTTTADGDADCLRTLPATIERTEPNRPKKGSWLHLADGRPVDRVAVSETAAREFRAGDRVRLTLWRGSVMKVEGERHVWQSHVTGGGEVAVLAAALALGAGYPAARIVLRLRARRRPDDEVLPSAAPFVAALVGTGLWLLPLGYVHSEAPLGTRATLAWAGAGSLVSLALLTWAWRATRAGTPGAPTAPDTAEETFIPARFLEATDYNPHHFGTHVVVGWGESPAVTPHPGPGRYAARPIPVHRLTLKTVRRARGGDGESVPKNWHVAELDDAGTPVHLTAAPADLPRLLAALTDDRPPSGAPAAPDQEDLVTERGEHAG